MRSRNTRLVVLADGMHGRLDQLVHHLGGLCVPLGLRHRQVVGGR
ncbi:hypothetical protein [Streptomyces sp. NRRL B-3648]|nr:hypothetical protein [Streptomyces sp. NRRL B-3648]